MRYIRPDINALDTCILQQIQSKIIIFLEIGLDEMCKIKSTSFSDIEIHKTNSTYRWICYAFTKRKGGREREKDCLLNVIKKKNK